MISYGYLYNGILIKQVSFTCNKQLFFLEGSDALALYIGAKLRTLYLLYARLNMEGIPCLLNLNSQIIKVFLTWSIAIWYLVPEIFILNFCSYIAAAF